MADYDRTKDLNCPVGVIILYTDETYHPYLLGPNIAWLHKMSSY